MATVNIYVDPDASGSATGNDFANAYTSLGAAITARATNLVTAGDIHHYHLRASAGTADDLADGVALNLSGYECDADNYIIFEACGDPITGGESQHGGVFNTNCYRIGHQGASLGTVFDINDTNIKLICRGLQIYAEADDAYDRAFSFRASGSCSLMELELDRCILRGYPSLAPAAANKDALFLRSLGSATTANFRMRNCVVYGWSSGITWYDSQSLDECYLYNCTFYGQDDYDLNNDAYAGSNLIVKNCVFAGCDGTEEIDDGTTGTFDYNATALSSNGRGSNGVDLSSYTADQIFTTPGSLDFHAETTGPLYQAGTSLSGIFTDDVDGETRAATWSIGADDPDGSSGGTASLALSDLVLGAPTLETVSLTVTNVLALSDLVLGAPALGSVSVFTGTVSLSLSDITLGSPTLGNVALNTLKALSLSDLVLTAPTLGNVVLYVADEESEAERATPISYIPVYEGYTVQPITSQVRARLEGGRSFFRSIRHSNPKVYLVTARFRFAYDSSYGFILRTIVLRGVPFKTDLVTSAPPADIDDPYPGVTHVCWPLPETIQLDESGYRGAFGVVMQFYAVPEYQAEAEAGGGA